MFTDCLAFPFICWSLMNTFWKSPHLNSTSFIEGSWGPLWTHFQLRKSEQALEKKSCWFTQLWILVMPHRPNGGHTGCLAMIKWIRPFQSMHNLPVWLDMNCCFNKGHEPITGATGWQPTSQALWKHVRVWLARVWVTWMLPPGRTEVTLIASFRLIKFISCTFQ